MKSLNSRAYLLHWLPTVIGFAIGLTLCGLAIVLVITFGKNVPMIKFGIVAGIVTLFAFVASIIGYFYTRSWARNYKYDLTDDGFISESGVFEINHLTIPYDRIISVDIKRGILARMLGLADLYLMTAGVVSTASGHGSSARPVWGRVPGITVDDATAFRTEVLKRVKQSKP